MGNGADVCTHRGASWESSGGQTLKFRVQPKAGLSRALVMQPDLEGMTCLDPSLPHGDPARSHCHSWPPFADGDADLDSHRVCPPLSWKREGGDRETRVGREGCSALRRDVSCPWPMAGKCRSRTHPRLSSRGRPKAAGVRS